MASKRHVLTQGPQFLHQHIHAVSALLFAGAMHGLGGRISRVWRWRLHRCLRLCLQASHAFPRVITR